MSSIRPGFLYEWMYIISPIEPSVKAGLNTGMLFLGKERGRKQRERREAVMEGGRGTERGGVSNAPTAALRMSHLVGPIVHRVRIVNLSPEPSYHFGR